MSPLLPSFFINVAFAALADLKKNPKTEALDRNALQIPLLPTRGDGAGYPLDKDQGNTTL
jgi:hypothetical protein